jgi:hypothetical protein
MKKRYIAIAIILLVIILSAVGMSGWLANGFSDARHFDDAGDMATSSFQYTFNVDGVLEEAGSMEESASKYWWVDSGALLSIHEGMGSTVQGTLPENNKWRMLYASSNSADTDNGRHPQNIFRLLTKNEWKNFSQRMYFRINADNMSDSSNRNESNGILLLSRFNNAGDLYYAGLRVDGHAIIKKKIDGKYHTLVEEPVLAGEYSRDAKKSLLPKDQWIGLRSDILTLEEGHVKIKLFADIGERGAWVLIADADDYNNGEDGRIIAERGHAGVRIDFMDVDFKNYEIDEL